MSDPMKLEAFRDGYVKVADAAVKVLQDVPQALDKSSDAHNTATVALLQLAAALEASRETIISALQHDAK